MRYDSLKMFEVYEKIESLNNEIDGSLTDFIIHANQLVELSEDDYQIEKTIRLNKISLKDYILNSSCCLTLKENNITHYSLEELEQFLIQYEERFHEDLSRYYLAISLYQQLENIESLVDSKIEMEITAVSYYYGDIQLIKKQDKKEYETLYGAIKEAIAIDYKHDKLTHQEYLIYIKLVDDIFEFYNIAYPNFFDYQ